MKTQGVLKHLGLGFLLALVGYSVLYFVIEQRRTRKGPWEVAFTSTPGGKAAIIINQPALRITNVQVTFVGSSPPGTNLFNTLRFREPRPVPYDVPFGKCV